MLTVLANPAAGRLGSGEVNNCRNGALQGAAPSLRDILRFPVNKALNGYGC